MSSIGIPKRQGRMPMQDATYYKNKWYVAEYRLRCVLEKALLEATLTLPNNAGINEEQAAELRELLDRDNPPLPTTARECEEDDLRRVHAIVFLIEARYNNGAETETTLKHWKKVEIRKEYDWEADARKKDPVLIALEGRRDRDFLEQHKRYEDYRAAMHRLFEDTVALPKHGYLPPASHIPLSHVFDSLHDRPDPIEAWWHRRNALIFILRARAKLGIQGEPELNGTWEGYLLPEWDSPTLQELTTEEMEAEGDVKGVMQQCDDGITRVQERLGIKRGFSRKERERKGALFELHKHEIMPVPDGVKISDAEAQGLAIRGKR